jgi:hypothetical protein
MRCQPIREATTMIPTTIRSGTSRYEAATAGSNGLHASRVNERSSAAADPEVANER